MIKHKLKLFFYAGLGHMLELYDYTLYAVMLPILSPAFFPADDPSVSIIRGMLSLSVAFFVASIGSIFWGWYGDKFGRLRMLQASILFMALPSLIISLLPDYHQIGIIAPSILIFCRIAQGISASAEIKGAKIFVMEHLGDKQLGITSGYITFSGAIGVAFAMLMGLLVSKYHHHDNLWRAPFLFGSILGIVGILIRKNLTESKLFLDLVKEKKSTNIATLPTIIREFRSQAFIVLILGGFIGVISYNMHAFMNPFITSIGYSKDFAFAMGIMALLCSALAALFTGIYIDKKNNSYNIITKNAFYCTLLFLPCFALILSHKIIFCIIAYIIMGSLIGINAASCSVVMYKLFPVHIRCRGILLCYTLGVSIFGGITPFTLVLLSRINPYAPAIMLTLFAFTVWKLLPREQLSA
jgi:MHS family proline/betaine transporter-like MFS transporter